jgi:hypothetical protein
LLLLEAFLQKQLTRTFLEALGGGRMAYAEDEPEEEPRNRLMFFGANLAEIPCFRQGNIPRI